MEDYTLEYHLREFLSERVEHLILKAEKMTDYIERQEKLQDSIEQFEKAVPCELDLEAFINNIKDGETPLSEYCYRIGIIDGIRIAGMIDRLEKGEYKE